MVDSQDNFFEPLHKAHSIEQVIFIVRFEQDIPQEKLQALKTILGKDHALPNRTPIRTVTFPIGVAAAPDVSPLAGYVYSRTSEDDRTEEELRLELSSITFKTFLYTRWEENWSQVRTYLEKLLPVYMEGTGVKEVSLLYADQFIWNGEMEQADPAGKLLRASSPYLVPSVYNVPDLWHSHTGAFLRADHVTKRLQLVEVDFVDLTKDSKPNRAVVVKTAITDTFNAPGYERSSLEKNAALEFINVHMNQLHCLNKKILHSIVNDEMCERIALGI